MSSRQEQRPTQVEMAVGQVYSSLQSEAEAQLKAEQARLIEANKENKELAGRLDLMAQDNGTLKLSLQQAQSSAAETKVQCLVFEGIPPMIAFLEEVILKCWTSNQPVFDATDRSSSSRTGFQN